MGRKRRVCDLLGVAAIEPDGLLISEDGTYVRYLEVGDGQPARGRASRGRADLRRVRADRRAAARPPVPAALCAGHAAGRRGASRGGDLPLRAGGRRRARTPASTSARRRSAGLGSPRSSRSARPPGRSARCGFATSWSARGSRRAGRCSALGADGRCASASRCTSGRSVTRCATPKASAQTSTRWAYRHGRCRATRCSTCCTAALTPTRRARGRCRRASCSREVVQPARVGESEDEADARAQALSEAICTAAIDLSDRSRVRIGDSLEQVFYVSLAPEQTWLGWLLHMMQAPQPVRAERACPGDRALPRADGAEAPLQAPVRRQPRRRAARPPA